MTADYTPGTAYAIVTSHGAALLDPTVPPAVAADVWGALEGAEGVGAVLQLLSGAFGTHLAAIPPFAVAVRRDHDVHIVVRGAFVVRVQGAAGVDEVSGVGVTTWNERLLPDAVELELVAPGSGSGAPALPLGTGVVLATSLRSDLRGLTAAVPAATATAVPAVGSVTSVLRLPEVLVEPARASLPLGIERTRIEVGEYADDVADDDVVDQAVVEQAVVDPDHGSLPVDAGSDLLDPPDAAAADSPAGELGDAPYDHLWGSTVLRSVEDAAVRASSDDDDDDDDAKVEGAAAGPGVPVSPEAQEGPASGDVAVSLPADPASIGLPTAAAAGWRPPPLIRPDTRAQSSVLDEPPAGDHDGETILHAALVELRAQAAGADGAAGTGAGTGALREVEPVSGAITVLARRCSQGHANPPEAPSCARCGLSLDTDAVSVPRPSLGRVLLSTGQVITLDRSLVVGRKPRVSRVPNGHLPRLVTVPSPEQDISRSHFEVRLEGWRVLLVDLGSTNGSTLLRPGRPPVRLHPHEPLPALSADVVDLGDGVVLTFEDLP